jgi:hypothetical protein
MRRGVCDSKEAKSNGDWKKSKNEKLSIVV